MTHASCTIICLTTGSKPAVSQPSAKASKTVGQINFPSKLMISAVCCRNRKLTIYPEAMDPSSLGRWQHPLRVYCSCFKITPIFRHLGDFSFLLLNLAT